MKVLLEHFKKLNCASDATEQYNYPDNQSTKSFINEFFTENEVLKAIKGLKRNKSLGVDQIINEYIIEASSLLGPVPTKLFNSILKTGLIPENWTVGIIIAIYKNKGPKTDPSNLI